jgi:hypothetical protein
LGRLLEPVAPGRGPRVIEACTIVAGNYVAAARVLAESFFAHHQDGSFTVLVVDDEQRDLEPDDEVDPRIVWWRLSDLGLSGAEIHRLAGIYDVVELSTSVKPLFLQSLMTVRGSAVIYLDPDTRVFGSLAYVPFLAEEHGIVLTPHMTRPIPDDGKRIDALFVLAAGMYNLGFAAVAPKAAPCLKWWWEQTRRRGLNDVQQQMFTDQRWADFIPSLFDHYLLKDPGYNVAYWNLHERPLTRVQGRLYAREAPLRFFHFSGFDPSKPWVLSQHQGDRPRILLSEHPVLSELCADYAGALDREGFARSNRRVYGWDTSADGLAMSSRIRRLYWCAVMASEGGSAPDPPDPFDTASPGAFTAWLNTPSDRGRWSRYVTAIYRARPDVQAHMPDIDGDSAPRFADWIRTDGVVQELIPPSLTPPAPSIEGGGACASCDPTAGEPLQGVNVTGYFHAELGMGEAGRLLTRAIEATGCAYRTASLYAPLSRHEHRFEASKPANGARFDLNLLCINADATPGFARKAGRAYFKDRYTIGYWFWEVDPFPSVMHAAFDHVDEVWTATEYVASILRSAAAGRKPVFTMPLPLMAPVTGGARAREKLGLPADRFVFLFVFDFLSVMERKNPLGAVEAFSAAFVPGEGPVLVLKSINGHACVSEMERLRRAAAHRTDILIQDGYVSAEERNELLAACDCYLSLHRAEGLGLTLAEAMALGKPAIATGFSGNRHFMSDENSFLVDYTLNTVSGDSGPYPPNARWAEPDLNHAARLMRTVYQHPTEAARRADRGRADLLLHHGVTSSAAAISSRLTEIRHMRAGLKTVTAKPFATPNDVASPNPATSVDVPKAKVEEPAPQVAEPARQIEEPAARVEQLPPSAAFEAFAASLPRLLPLAEPRLSQDWRPFQGLRRAAQRVLFRLIRPYWFQQRQYHYALLEAVLKSLEKRGEATRSEKDRNDGA